MIIDTHLHPTNLVDEAWRHTGTPFNGERMLKMMDGPFDVVVEFTPRRNGQIIFVRAIISERA